MRVFAKYFKDISLFCFFFFLCIFLLFNNYSFALQKGLCLWALTILPSLFPFFFISYVLSNLKIGYKFINPFSKPFNRFFGLNKNIGYCFFISLMSGYPIGSKLVSDFTQKGLISKSEQPVACAICSTPSPAFLISVVGGIMFNNKNIGLIMYCSNIISVFIVGIIFKFIFKPLSDNKDNFQSANGVSFYDSVYSSVISILVVGGIITLFFLFSQIALDLGLLNPIIYLTNLIVKDSNLSQAFVVGLLEFSQGFSMISKLPFSVYTLPLLCFISGFGGLSVIMQSVAHLKNGKIKTAPFILSKIMCAVISGMLGLVFYFFIF